MRNELASLCIGVFECIHTYLYVHRYSFIYSVQCLYSWNGKAIFLVRKSTTRPNFFIGLGSSFSFLIIKQQKDGWFRLIIKNRVKAIVSMSQCDCYKIGCLFYSDLVTGFQEQFWILRIDHWILIKILKLTINDLVFYLWEELEKNTCCRFSIIMLIFIISLCLQDWLYREKRQPWSIFLLLWGQYV